MGSCRRHPSAPVSTPMGLLGVAEGDETTKSKFAKRTWNVLWNQRNRKNCVGKETLRPPFRSSMPGLKPFIANRLPCEPLTFGEVGIACIILQKKDLALKISVTSLGEPSRRVQGGISDFTDIREESSGVRIFREGSHGTGCVPWVSTRDKNPRHQVGS